MYFPEIVFALFIIAVVFLLAFVVRKSGRRCGGTFIDEYGYRRFKDSGKLVHRWVAEKKIGRKLRREEVVHHIDKNKLNNSPENLHVCKNQFEHERIHFEEKLYSGKARWI